MNHSIDDIGPAVAQLAAWRDRVGRAGRVEVTLGAGVPGLDELHRYAAAGVDRVLVRPWRDRETWWMGCAGTPARSSTPSDWYRRNHRAHAYEAFGALRIERPEAGVLKIVLDGPGLNAVGPQAHRELADVWRTVDRDPDTAVAVLTGAG